MQGLNQIVMLMAHPMLKLIMDFLLPTVKLEIMLHVIFTNKPYKRTREIRKSVSHRIIRQKTVFSLTEL